MRIDDINNLTHIHFDFTGPTGMHVEGLVNDTDHPALTGFRIEVSPKNPNVVFLFDKDGKGYAYLVKKATFVIEDMEQLAITEDLSIEVPGEKL